MREEIKKAIDDASSRTVDLGRSQIRDSELQEIAEYIIQVQPNIFQIILDHNPITDNGAIILANALAPLVSVGKKLNLLSLCYTHVGEKGYTELCEKLVALNPSFDLHLHAAKLNDPNSAFDIHQAAIKKFHENQAKKKAESHRPSTPPDEPTPPSSSKRPRTK